MNKYIVFVKLGADEIDVPVKAPDLDTAIQQIKGKTVLQFLEGKTLGELDLVMGGCSAEVLAPSLTERECIGGGRDG